MNVLPVLLLVAAALACPVGVYANGPLSPRAEGMAAFALDDYATARRLLAPIAEEGDQEAMWSMGVLLANGEGGPRDFAESYRLFRRAAEAGHTRAYYDVGLMYQLGEGRPANMEKATDWYTRGVEIGCGACARMLGLAFVDGREVLDAPQAERWFRRAAELGDLHGMELLARWLVGIRGEAALDEAVALLEEAHQRGWQGARLIGAAMLWASHRKPEDAERSVDTMRALVEERVFEGIETQRSALLYRLVRSAALGWGMEQDWTAALEYAAELDSLRRALELDEHYSGVSERYPSFDDIRALITALGDWERSGIEMSCESASALMQGAKTRVLPVEYLKDGTPYIRQLQLATHRCNNGSLDGIDPEHEYFDEAYPWSGRILLDIERILPSEARDGIGLVDRTRAP